MNHARHAESDFDMTLDDSQRWEHERKRVAYPYDNLEEINNVESDASDDDDTSQSLQC